MCASCRWLSPERMATEPNHPHSISPGPDCKPHLPLSGLDPLESVRPLALLKRDLLDAPREWAGIASPERDLGPGLQAVDHGLASAQGQDVLGRGPWMGQVSAAALRGS